MAFSLRRGSLEHQTNVPDFMGAETSGAAWANIWGSLRASEQHAVGSKNVQQMHLVQDTVLSSLWIMNKLVGPSRKTNEEVRPHPLHCLPCGGSRCAFATRRPSQERDYYRGGPPQNGSEIPSFSGSRNGPYKDKRFGATLRNDHDNFSPAFAGLRFGKPSKQSCTQGNLQKPQKTFRKLKTARNLRNSAETMQKPMQKPSKSHKMAETLRKPLGNPAETQENLQKTSGNPAETPRKPCRNPRKPLHSPFGN